MNHEQLHEVAEWVLTRWPKAKAWTKAEAFYDDFADVDQTSALRSLETMFAEGRKFAPTPSELMVRASRPAGGWLGRPIPEECSHFNWHIVEYETEREDGKRFGLCASCLTERLADSTRGQMLNSIEREERAKAHAEDRALGGSWSSRRDLDV